MIGSLLLGGRAVVEMQDSGIYTAVSPTYAPLAEYLNLSASPTANSEVGDVHAPFGVAALYRAALLVKGTTAHLAQPVPDLPKGAIS